MTLKSIKILIAEDELALSNALQLKLKKEGYDTVIAGNGQEAIEQLDKDKFDLVLLDLVMPVVDGFGVMEHVKAKNIKTKIVVLSNLSQIEDIGRVKTLGASDYFIKSEMPLSEIIAYIKKNIG